MSCVQFALAQDSSGASSPSGSRFTYGGEFFATFAPKDQGYFNYTDYDYSLLRLVTATFVGAYRVHPRLEFLGEARLQNTTVTASALYARVRPWREAPLAIQAGRIPPVFGRFSRYSYGRANPLIGVPLPYQYLTTLRSSQVPVGTDALLAVRGRGWLVGYANAIGEPGTPNRAAGLPLITSTRWDTGVQTSFAGRRFDAAAAFTNGSLSNPRVIDDNAGKQLAGRVTWRPLAALDVGVSAARGAFLTRQLTRALPLGTPRQPYRQVAVGIDTELSRDHWLVRAEIMRSTWTLPALGTPSPASLAATATILEGGYRIGPRWQAAARGERLLFSRLSPSDGRPPLPWDAPVARVELGVAYTLARHVVLKSAWQYNWRNGVSRPRPREGFLAIQVAAWY